MPDYLKADTLADALNLREGVLQDLNPALMESVWAGDKLVPKGFELRVPRATAAVAEDLLASIAPAERYAAQRPDLQHRVRRGDTLSAIAAQYRVSLATLMRINGLTGRSVLRVGQMISLPGGVGRQHPPAQVVLACRHVAPSPPTPPCRRCPSLRPASKARIPCAAATASRESRHGSESASTSSWRRTTSAIAT